MEFPPSISLGWRVRSSVQDKLSVCIIYQLKKNKKDMFVSNILSSVLLEPAKDIEKVNLEEETFWFI